MRYAVTSGCRRVSEYRNSRDKRCAVKDLDTKIPQPSAGMIKSGKTVMLMQANN